MIKEKKERDNYKFAIAGETPIYVHSIHGLSAVVDGGGEGTSLYVSGETSKKF
jgi:hypothetical protein